MIVVASFAAKCRCCVAYRTSVEYSTANPRVAKIWMKKSTPAPSGICEKRAFKDDTVVGPVAAGPAEVEPARTAPLADVLVLVPVRACER